MKPTLLILSTIISIGAAAQIPTTGMIAGWTFDGNANDISGNGHNGIVVGATLTTNRVGTANAAYSFNGTSNYIRVPSAASLTPANMTICAEVRPTGFYSGPCQVNAVVNKGNEGTNGYYSLTFSDNPYDNGNCANLDTLHDVFHGVFGNNTTSQANHLYTPYILSNTWYCAVTTFDGSTIKMYIDGTLKASYAATNAMAGDTNALFIGAYGPDLVQFPYWFKGIIDDIHIYNRALTNTEIQGYCSFLAGVDETGSIASHVNVSNLGNGLFELKLDKSFNKVNITIISALGQTVYSSSTNNSLNDIIDLSCFAKGMYLVNVVTEEGTFTAKIVRE